MKRCLASSSYFLPKKSISPFSTTSSFPSVHLTVQGPWRHSIAPEIISKKSFIQIHNLNKTDSYEKISQALKLTHAFQLSSAKSDIFIPMNNEFWDKSKNLLVISAGGVGVDTIDVEECNRRGILVVNQAGLNKEAVAEHCLGMMLVLGKKIIQGHHALLSSDRKWNRLQYEGQDIWGKTLGIIGLGNVGTQLAHICSSIFKMNILAFDPYLSELEIQSRYGKKIDNLHDLLSQCDYISINCPLTPETTGMIGKNEFKQMKKSAYFITTARGKIHCEISLINALTNHEIAGAGIDVFDIEPPPSTHPLLKFSNVILSPHIAGVTQEAQYTMAKGCGEQLVDIFEGKKPSRIENPEIWSKFSQRYETILGRKIL